MNNARAKTILIVFFLLTNIILLIMLLDSYNRFISIPEETIKTTADFLSHRGIQINEDLIPNKIGKEKIITVTNVIDTYENFAKKVLPDNPTIENGVYKNESATVNFYGDRFRITFKDGISTSEKDRSPSDKARTYLNSIGINTNGAHITSNNNAEGLFSVTFSKSFYKKPFFDCTVTVELKGKSITSVHGCWFERTQAEQTVRLASAPSLLVSYFTKNPNYKDVKVTSLQSGYAISENGVFHKQVTLLPVYAVTTDTNEILYIDARGN